MRYWAVRLGSLLVAVVACVALEKFAGGQSSFAQRLIVLAGLYVTLAVSLNLINGITGQFSIGHAAFYMVGAYSTGFLASAYYPKFSQIQLPGFLAQFQGPIWLFLMMLASAAVAAIAGLVVGLPSLRLRGDYLAIVTLGFGEILRIVAQNQPKLGGAYGLAVTPRFQFIWIVWLLAILCIAVCRNLLKTAHGLPFLAVREDEVASSAMGVNVTRVKVTAFLIGSMFAGAAGALLAHFEGFVSPAMFTMDVSFIILTMVVLGGTGSITGSALAAVVLFYLPEKMRDLGDVKMGMLVAVAIGIVLFISLMRRLSFHYHGPKLIRVAYGAAILVGSLAVMAIGGRLLGSMPALAATVEGSKLRLVVFAVTLVALMLLRPQGIFGHHEFSWSWVKSLFGRRPVPHTAVSS